MNRKVFASLLLAGMLAGTTGLSWAQDAPPPPMGDRIELLGFEGMRGGKIVTGAPFSGVAVTESTQTLADGNHITRKTQSNLFRDSEGRVRKEVTLSGFVSLAVSGEPKSFVVINDPVTKANFVLHPETKVAEKMSHGDRGMNGMAKAGKFEEKLQARQEAEIAAGNLKKEDLGAQVMGGLVAQGTRVTRTIPAGQIGNEKPIVIVHETWFSNDLQMVVMSRRSNPWIGETTYTLTNIQRTEPAAALFAVPSDFTVTEGRPFGKRGAPGYKQIAPMPPPPEN
jgi:hypothetical protein